MELSHDWNGKQIGTARTPGKTLLMCDPFDALMRPPNGPWPPPALVMMLGEGESKRHPYTSELRASVSSRLGHYCALQSINAEDAITWNFFGTLMLAPEDARAAFLNWLCGRLNLPWTRNTQCAIDLWRRIPHPYFPGSDGPELDAVLDGNRCVVFVEAKWLSPEGTGRGPNATRVGQMHLRQAFFKRWGAAIYGSRGKLVLGVMLGKALAQNSGPDESQVTTRSITWHDLAGYDGHPNGDEFTRYLAWKEQHSPGAKRMAFAKGGQR